MIMVEGSSMSLQKDDYKWFIPVIGCLLFFLFCYSSTSIQAAPPPSEIERIKEESPLQLKGIVVKDTLVEDVSDDHSYPRQIRSMVLKVEEVIKQPDTMQIKKQDEFTIRYSFIPDWVSMAGSAPVDVIVQDQIEIWLQQDDEGAWIPPLSGSTITHHYYEMPRIEPLDKPERPFLEEDKDRLVKGFIVAGFMILAVLSLCGLIYAVRSVYKKPRNF